MIYLVFCPTNNDIYTASYINTIYKNFIKVFCIYLQLSDTKNETNQGND